MKNKRISFTPVLALVILMLFSIAVSAAPVAQTDSCSLTVNFTHNNKPVSGTAFLVYKVASVGSNGKVNPCGKFASYPVILDNLDADGLTDAALTLSGYVLRDKIAADYKGITNKEGLVTFPENGGKMTPGMYLVIGDPVDFGSDTLVPKPFIVTLPYQNEETGEYHNNVIAYAKYDVVPHDGGKIKIEVAKVWHNDNKSSRPAAITVLLLRDGVLYESVKLEASNNWRHKWTELEKGHLWTVVENEVSGYTVRIHNESYVVIINNTDDTPPDEPTEPTKPTEPTEPTNKTNPTGTTNPNDTTKPTEEIPNTGMLWWPIYAFSIAGLFLFIIGWALVRKNEYE